MPTKKRIKSARSHVAKIASPKKIKQLVDTTVPICGHLSFSDYFSISDIDFKNTGAFDQILNRDSHLMIDPKLLNSSSAPELRGAYNLVLKHFRSVFKLLHKMDHVGDRFWTAAYQLCNFSEFKGVSLGYSANSGDGSGWGAKLRRQVLESAKTIIHAGLDDPEFFELLALFESNIGSDRISDMIGTILISPLCKYTERVCRELDVPLSAFDIRNATYPLPSFMNEDGVLEYVILVPRDVLSNLPLALDRASLPSVFSENEALRAHLNLQIGQDWQAQIRAIKGKEITRSSFFENIKTFTTFIDRYRSSVGKPYDFTGDPDNIRLWYEMARRAIETDRLDLTLPSKPTEEDLYQIVRSIVLHFKRLVEDNKLREALYIEGRPRKEKIVQAVFLAIAQTHCSYNDLDISAETDAGRGPVDFKLSKGHRMRALVEIKLSNSTRLLQGYEIQLQEYKRAEATPRAIYLVLDVGMGAAAISKLKSKATKVKGQGKPELIIIEGKKKPSASKMR